MAQSLSQGDIEAKLAEARRHIAEKWGWFLALGIVLSKQRAPSAQSLCHYSATGCMDLAAYSTVLGRKSGTSDPSHGTGPLLASGIAYPSENLRLPIIRQPACGRIEFSTLCTKRCNCNGGSMTSFSRNVISQR